MLLLPLRSPNSAHRGWDMPSVPLSAFWPLPTFKIASCKYGITQQVCLTLSLCHHPLNRTVKQCFEGASNLLLSSYLASIDSLLFYSPWVYWWISPEPITPHSHPEVHSLKTILWTVFLVFCVAVTSAVLMPVYKRWIVCPLWVFKDNLAEATLLSCFKCNVSVRACYILTPQVSTAVYRIRSLII